MVVRKNFVSVLGMGLVFLSAGCFDQYDRSADWSKFQAEQQIANKPPVTLTEQGELPKEAPSQSSGAVAAASPVDEAYNNYCVSCHGLSGKADTPAALALNPKPRNFTDAAWQDKVSDEHIKTVILKGGASVGLSPSMAPWEAVLPGDLPVQMVKKIRSFK